MKDFLKDSVSLRILAECGKMQTTITLNTDTFYSVYSAAEFSNLLKFVRHYISIIPQKVYSIVFPCGDNRTTYIIVSNKVYGTCKALSHCSRVRLKPGDKKSHFY